MTRGTTILTALLLLGSSNATAQEGTCPPPRYTVEAFKERLLELGRAARFNAISGLVSVTLTPGPAPACGSLPDDVDLQEVMEDLIRFVADQGESDLETGFFLGIREALLVTDERREHRTMPLDALAYAVERGRTGHGRGTALRMLLRFAQHPEVRAYLVRQARAPQGPPAWPDLPESIVTRVYFGASERDADLRAELEADLSRIRNPRARCLVENRGRQDNPPGAGPRCPGGGR